MDQNGTWPPLAPLVPPARLLLGPGPSSVPRSVLDALAAAPVGYTEPFTFTVYDDVRAALRALFGTRNSLTLALTGTGMAAMESCFANLVRPGDRVVVCSGGYFGDGMADMAARYGAETEAVRAESGQPVDPAAVRACVDRGRAPRILACVHAETSTGVAQALPALGRICADVGALFVVDAVTSLGGMEVGVDSAGVDVAYAATQKCIGSVAGLAPITVSDRALAAASEWRSEKPAPVWYLDWLLLRDYFDAPRAYHHTVPCNLWYALHEALRLISQEGMAARYERHRAVSADLRERLTRIGLEPLVQGAHALPMLTTCAAPAAPSEEAGLRARLLERFGIEIGGGLGESRGRIWRIGTMGASASAQAVAQLCDALDTILPQH